MDSHYCIASSTRKYLDSKLTIKKMYEQFIEYYNENLPTESSGQDIRIPSQKVYRDLFCNEYNLSFFHPKKISVPLVLLGTMTRQVLIMSTLDCLRNT